MAYIGNQPLATAVTNADISSSAAIDLSKLATSGDLSATNVTLGGYLRGPSTFTIDPAAHGDNTGTLVIAGNLQIDGTTTTVNSTTMTVDDKNITVASGAANAAAADQAGITVDGASATLLYNATPDAWSFNKKLGIGTSSPSMTLDVDGSGGPNDVARFSGPNSGGLTFRNSTSNEFIMHTATSDALIFGTGGNNERMRITSSGDVTVGTADTQPPTNNDASGIALRSDGKIAASRSGGISGDFNRGSDGDIVWFRKSGTVVGKIGNSNGSSPGDLFISSGVSGHAGLGFGGGPNINPTNNDGALSDNTVDLGSSSHHFKDLYLGGGVVDTTTTVSYASSIALSYTNGAIQTVTLTGNATFTDSLNDGEAIVLMLNGGASHTVTWTAVTKWVTGSGNAAPTLTASDAIILWKIGSSVYAATAGSFA
jgi:hypothetical protein